MEKDKSLKNIKLKYFLVILTMYLTSLFGTLYMIFPYLPLLFVNRKIFHRLSDYSLDVWFSLSVYLLERACGIKVYIHNSKLNKFEHSTKSSIVLMNHRTRLDWMFYFCLLYRVNALSNIKIILKEDLKKIIGPNWAMQTALFIFIKRRWESDKVTFSRFLDYYKKIEKNVMILIFPEGTNLTLETKKRSDHFAELNQLPKYDYVLHPRTTGFAYILRRMQQNDSIDCIQDVTVAYHGGRIPESEFGFLKGDLPSEIHFYVDKFRLDDVLKEVQKSNGNINHHTNGVVNGIGDEEKQKKVLEAWLFKRWNEKEAFLRRFYESNRKNNSIEPFDSNYETVEGNDRTSFLFLYPIYWLLSSLLMLYLSYHYFYVKVYFIVAFSFYMLNQYYGSGLDNFIFGRKSSDDFKKFE